MPISISGSQITLPDNSILNGTNSIRTAISVSGSGTYNSSTGIITINGGVTSVNGSSGDVTGLATIASPTFTGTPAAPTAAAGTNTTQLATTAFVSTAVANLVASAPAALDTLNELATALGNDANFSTTITTSLGNKLNTSGGTLTGALSITNNTASSSTATGALIVTGGVGIGGALYATNANLSGTLTESSSIVYKENIQPITNALELVTQLTGVTYDRIDGSAKNRAGLIKEAVEQVLPNIVHEDGIQYTNIIAYLVESIKELKHEIDMLRGV